MGSTKKSGLRRSTLASCLSTAMIDRVEFQTDPVPRFFAVPASPAAWPVRWTSAAASRDSSIRTLTVRSLLAASPCLPPSCYAHSSHVLTGRVKVAFKSAAIRRIIGMWTGSRELRREETLCKFRLLRSGVLSTVALRRHPSAKLLLSPVAGKTHTTSQWKAGVARKAS
jgi:hypothetical protein